MEKYKERSKVELLRRIKEMEWKSVRERRNSRARGRKGERERGREEKENALEGKRERYDKRYFLTG